VFKLHRLLPSGKPVLAEVFTPFQAGGFFRNVLVTEIIASTISSSPIRDLA
jgi:hypothetical protein